MSKIKLTHAEVLQLNWELQNLSAESLPIFVKFQLSKIHDDVKKIVELIAEVQKGFKTKSVKNEEGEDIYEIVGDDVQRNHDLLFKKSVELEHPSLKIKDLKGLITDKPYNIVFKFFQ